jgi:hypothetical protein
MTQDQRAPKWPYGLALGWSILCAVAFLLAPFSGIVYFALPALAFATYWAWKHQSPIRMALSVATGLFAIGFIVGTAGVGMAAVGLVGDSFFAQEVGFAIAAVALWAMPVLAVIVGVPSSALALARPGMPIDR